MGGEQAAMVLSQLRRDNIEANGENWSTEEEEKFRSPIRAQYESQGNPYYATARLWDDGVIDPAIPAGAGARPVGSGERADRTDEIRPVQDVTMDRSRLYRRFRTLLIANRGEIACRVIRTARAMGLRSVAVYSEADRGAMHVAEADESVLLGSARARDSYLNIERIIDAARKSGAEVSIPATGSCRRMPSSRRPAPMPGWCSLVRPPR